MNEFIKEYVYNSFFAVTHVNNKECVSLILNNISRKFATSVKQNIFKTR